jgi:probable HAF family extracellular repeat protein
MKTLLIAFVLVISASKAHTAAYSFTSLGASGGTDSSANAINNAGVVAGWARTAAGQAHATVWDGPKATDLGTLGGDFSIAHDINDAGQVVGEAYRADTFSRHATIWNGTKATELGALEGVQSSAKAINNAGQVAGWAEVVGGENHAALWNGAQVKDLGERYQGDTSAEDINEAGQVVGNMFATGILWTGSNSTQLGLQGASFTGANAINESGQIVGSYTYLGNDDEGFPQFDYGAAKWNGTAGVYLDAGGDALAINDAGVSVGSLNGHAVLWNDTTPIDLNSLVDKSKVPLGWMLTNATDINNKGWIVGEATELSTGLTHAFVLSPVPEAESYVLFLAGLGLIATLSLRRRLSLADSCPSSI